MTTTTVQSAKILILLQNRFSDADLRAAAGRTSVPIDWVSEAEGSTSTLVWLSLLLCEVSRSAVIAVGEVEFS